MKSIRAQLLGWFPPGFVVVFTAAGSGVYFSTKQATGANLEARLGRLAGSARLALRNQMSDNSCGAKGAVFERLRLQRGIPIARPVFPGMDI